MIKKTLRERERLGPTKTLLLKNKDKKRPHFNREKETGKRE